MNNLALQTAWMAHSKQKRKSSDIPYIIHPIEVALILIENGANEDLITAGLLHDTLEDTAITEEFIYSNFGAKVTELVKAASEPQKLGLEAKLSKEDEIKSWKERKTHTIHYISDAPLEVKLLTCADKLSNIRSTIRDYKEFGNKLWERFNAGCKDQNWYYEELVKSLKELCGYKMYDEFVILVEDFFSSAEIIGFLQGQGDGSNL